MREPLVIPPGVAEAIVAHARAAAPRECCGLVSGDGRRCRVVHPLTNVAASADEFAADDRQQTAVREAVRASGGRIVAVYHSHPRTEARPSRADVARWFTPRVAHVIVSLAGAEPELRAFCIDPSTDPPVHELAIADGRTAPA
ncbi:MAG: M67 family metallopeptidase [Thermoleophilia bacterium]|nr:M67 family metallopeptidase [Thermoleophilia bacterium]